MKVWKDHAHHHKNSHGLNLLINFMGYEFSSFDDADIIFSAGTEFDPKKYPNKKFIFGPQFSIFPTEKAERVLKNNPNAIYIQPSKQTVNLWKDEFDFKFNITPFPFPVDVDRFKSNNVERKKIFLYVKNRRNEDVMLMKSFLERYNIKYVEFNYSRRYNENQYLNYLNESKFGIWVGSHESQGFALQEALSMDVPLLVWSTKTMKQEYNNYDSYQQELKMITAPYWDERCGEIFFDSSQLNKTFEIFIDKLHTYKPREYVVENLSVEPCANRLHEIINKT